jgi:putative ABC transport system permease protein
MMNSILAWRNLLRNPRRSLVLMATVAMGVLALFLFDGFNKGIMSQYKENTIHAKYGHGQINREGYREQVFEKPWEHWIQNSEAVLTTLRNTPGITHVFPRNDFYALLTNGIVNVTGKGTGIDGPSEADFFHTINIVQGQTLRDEADGIILGLGLARALNVEPGDRVTLLVNTIHGSMNGLDFRVIGIFHTGLKEIDDTHFRIQRTAAQTLLDTTAVESIALGLAQEKDWPDVIAAIKAKHPELEATTYAVLDKVYYQNAVDWLGQQFAVIQLIIVFIILLGIINTFSFTIMERTAEIGNLRANGDAPFEVLSLLIWEGFFIGLLGSLTGLFCGWLFNTLVIPNGILMPPAPGLTRQFFVRIELQTSMMFVATAMGVGTSLAAVTLTAWKRVRMPIAAALRYR